MVVVGVVVELGILIAHLFIGGVVVVLLVLVAR